MLKKTITYEDFNGNSRKEDFYFNLTKTELMEIMSKFEAAYGANFEDQLMVLADSEDTNKMFPIVKELVLTAYGEKSDDGKYFVKNEIVRNKFENTQAFSDLFMEIATNPTTQQEFIVNIMPADLRNDIKQALKKAKK